MGFITMHGSNDDSGPYAPGSISIHSNDDDLGPCALCPVSTVHDDGNRVTR